jgi:hypothetical protein
MDIGINGPIGTKVASFHSSKVGRRLGGPSLLSCPTVSLGRRWMQSLVHLENMLHMQRDPRAVVHSLEGPPLPTTHGHWNMMTVAVMPAVRWVLLGLTLRYHSHPEHRVHLSVDLDYGQALRQHLARRRIEGRRRCRTLRPVLEFER